MMLSVVEVEALARRLSPYRMGAAGESTGDGGEDPLAMSNNPPLLEFMGIPGDPITFDVQQAWRPRPKRDRYRIPFGIGEHGNHSLEEVGQVFEVPRERFRQLEAKALRKVRHPSRSKLLQSFIET